MNEYTFEQLQVGQTETFAVTVTDGMMDAFRLLSGDVNPLHCDPVFAKTCGYPGVVCYGLLTGALLSRLAGVHLPGKNSLIHSVEIEFPAPVFVGDALTVTGVVKEKDERFRTIGVKAVVVNGEGRKVCRGKLRIGFTG